MSNERFQANALDLLKIGQPVKVIYTGAGKRVETR